MQGTIVKRKDRRGRIEGYASHLVGLPYSSETCPTVAEARADFDREITAALGRLAEGTQIHRWQGRTIVVFPTCAGWGYTFDDLTSGCLQEVRGEYGAAVNHAYHHAAQCAWTAETNDRDLVSSLPPKVRDVIGRDLLAYFQWQRGYRAGRIAGQTDDECRETAARWADTWRNTVQPGAELTTVSVATVVDR
jgi:hypothetical protein